MANRFRRPKDKEEIFKALVNGDDAPFNTFKDVFILAACIGFNQHEPLELPPGGEQIHWAVFDQNTDQIMLNAIALCEKNDFTILSEKDEATDVKFSLIEQYVNAGMNVLKKEILDTPGNSLDNLVDLIFAQESDLNQQNNRDLLGEIDVLL